MGGMEENTPPPKKEKGAGTFGEGKTITLQEKEGQVLLGVWGRGKHSPKKGGGGGVPGA